MGLTAPVPVNAEGKLAVHLFFLQVTEKKDMLAMPPFAVYPAHFVRLAFS